MKEITKRFLNSLIKKNKKMLCPSQKKKINKLVEINKYYIIQLIREKLDQIKFEMLYFFKSRYVHEDNSVENRNHLKKNISLYLEKKKCPYVYIIYNYFVCQYEKAIGMCLDETKERYLYRSFRKKYMEIWKFCFKKDVYNYILLNY
jgi:hypothetical protein